MRLLLPIELKEVIKILRFIFASKARELSNETLFGSLRSTPSKGRKIDIWQPWLTFHSQTQISRQDSESMYPLITTKLELNRQSLSFVTREAGERRRGNPKDKKNLIMHSDRHRN
jgi:hypothetical protein